MKTNELIKKVEILGYEITKKQFIDDTNYFVIYNSFGGTMCYVAINKLFEMNIRLDEYMSEELFDLIVEYAKTPVEDRKDEEKFYLKHRYFEIAGGGRGFFTIHNKSELPFLRYKTSSDNYNQIFTLKEIEEIKKRFNTDLKDFELVEVKNDKR